MKVIGIYITSQKKISQPGNSHPWKNLDVLKW